MREIKFRLYNKHDKQMYIFEPQWGNFGQGGGWVGGVLLSDYEKDGRTFAPSNQWQLEPESCEWLQFTGLLDKNGKEIYEGDILAPMPNDDRPQYEGNWTVIYREGAFFGEGENREIETWLPYWQPDAEIEVIGNIYENPIPNS